MNSPSASPATGIALPASPPWVIEDFLVAIKAAVLGQGLALVPLMLVQDELADGTLVEFSPARLTVDHTYHIAHTTASTRRPYVQQVVDWLRASLAHLN